MIGLEHWSKPMYGNWALAAISKYLLRHRWLLDLKPLWVTLTQEY